MIEQADINVRLGDGSTTRGRLDFSVADPCWIELKLPDHPVIRGEASDLFACLAEIRKKLEPMGIQLICHGSLINVYPSAMSRDMSSGRKAYLTTMGKQGTRDDLVDIFGDEYADIEAIGSVQEQKQFHESWFKSLGQVERKDGV